MSTKGLMSQKQWITHDESLDKSSALIKKVSLSLLLTPIVVAVLLGVVLGQYLLLPLVGMVLGVALQRGVIATSRSAFQEVVVSPVASETVHARVYNVVDGLCVVSGDQRPSLVLIDSAYPVAVAAIDADGSHVIGVSQQFMNVMTRVEVEAVAAHLLWRLRVGHGRLVAYLYGFTKVLSFVGLGSVGQKVAARALSAHLVTIADFAACQSTRFPPAAVSALEECEASEGLVSVGMGEFLAFALPSDAHGDAVTGHKVSNLVVSRPRLSDRVAILKEM